MAYKIFLIAADYTLNLSLITLTTSQNTTAVHKMLIRIGSTFGKSELIITDNGAPLYNDSVHVFAHKAYVRLTHSSVYYPRENSKVIQSVRPLMTILKLASLNYVN